MRAFSGLAILVLVLGALPGFADDIADRGRAVMEANQSAVVTLQLVLKEKFGMPGMASRDTESTTEATGTVIGADGLTVLSLFKTDPTTLVEALMPSFGGGMGDVNMSTEVEEVRFLMKDGTEIPAEVLLRDKDLDMVFVRPIEKQEEAFAYIDLEKSAEPVVLDHLVTLKRLGKVAGRSYSASLLRVESVVERPRRFYIPENAQGTIANLGAPAFTLDGKIVGVHFLRLMNTGASMSGMAARIGGMEDMLATIVLPAEDILESASQVPPFE